MLENYEKHYKNYDYKIHIREVVERKIEMKNLSKQKIYYREHKCGDNCAESHYVR
jgi:hypothetical protein